VPRSLATVLETVGEENQLVVVGTDFLFGDTSGFADFTTTETRHFAASVLTLRVSFHNTDLPAISSASWIARSDS
jgi:hypothetical protein